MNTLPPRARPGNAAVPQSHPRRVAEAHRRHHEAQVGLSCGEPNSLATEEAEAAYREAAADGVAANFTKVQDLVEAMRFVAEDESGLRELAGRYSNEITGAVPAHTFAVLADVIESGRDTRREVVALGVELLDAVTRVAALRADLKAVSEALASAGIAVKS